MSKHRLLHLAYISGHALIGQCDCPYQGGSHTLDDPYRQCFECGAQFATEYILVEKHLDHFRNQEHLDPKYWATPTDGDYHGENIYSCPECTHDW